MNRYDVEAGSVWAESMWKKWDREAVKVFLYFPSFRTTTATTKENNDEQIT